ncbi:MAG: hypothetical protein ACI38U_12855 [Corynebacterium sp.]|uniref:hypothetical protein n=1 Tax=Corynebacterium sp. TaxID=1720 RepID=UPI003F0E5244
MPNHHPGHDTDPGTNDDTEDPAAPDSDAAITAAYAVLAAETRLNYEHARRRQQHAHRHIQLYDHDEPDTQPPPQGPRHD